MDQVLPKNGDAFYIADAWSTGQSHRILSELQQGIAWEQTPIRIFGKSILQPRLTAWYGDEGANYQYSGLLLKPRPWTPQLFSIKTRVEELAPSNFNSVLLNFYRTGQDSMGWHRDNERELGHRPVIASATFGATRRFLFRHRLEKSLKVEIELAPGSLLIMSGDCQESWEHSLPKTAKAMGPRINLTFRKIIY